MGLRRFTCAWLWLLVSLVAAPAHGASTPDTDLGSYFRVLWGLCLVLALMLVLFAFFKKRFSLVSPKGGRAIRVIEIQPLAPRKSVCLIEVRGQEFLIGIANESLTLLADLRHHPPRQTSFEEILASQQEAQP